MVSIGFKVMLFAFLINIACGAIIYLGVGGVDNIVHADVIVNQNSTLTSLQTNVSSFPVEASSNAFSMSFRILDFISLGLFSKVEDFLSSTVLAFPTILCNVGLTCYPSADGTSMDNGMSLIVNGIFVLIYTLGMFELITGRRIL